MKYVKFEKDPKRIKDFLSLPKKLYTPDRNTENESQTKELLLGEHPLNKYFTMHKFLIYSDSDLPVGRFVITAYEGDPVAYLGFYECIDDKTASDFLFGVAEKFARAKGFKSILGPVDASFWIKYRLKTNFFNFLPYTCEPYNNSYYLNQFLRGGYEICEHYSSNIFKPVERGYTNEKYSKRYKTFIDNGYEITSPDMKNFDKVLEELYALITELYSDFPVFKPIEKEDFCELFSSFEGIIDPSMVKLAYYNKRLVGFFISVPNYHADIYHPNASNITRILKTKNAPEEYVMLYMGVDPDHTGLGKALSYRIINALRGSSCTSIGALMRDGKKTLEYGSELVDGVYEYVLLERKL